MGEARKRGTLAERRSKAKVECHAQITVTAGAQGLAIEMTALNEPENPAVMFAKWVCEHSNELFQQMVTATAAKSLVAAPRDVALVGPDGRKLQ